MPQFSEVTPETPVVVLTADTAPDLADRVCSLGAFRLLSKPTRIASLAEVLNDATNYRAARRDVDCAQGRSRQ